MNKGFRLHRSLNTRMLFSQLLSLACALLIFFAAAWVGRYTVQHIYMSPENVSARKASIYAAFNAYVRELKVYGSDERAIARFTRQRRYVNIVVYPESDPTFNQAGTAQYGKLYPMAFADGRYQIAISDTSDLREQAVNDVLSVVLAALVYIVLQVGYTGRLTRRIVSLAHEAEVVGSGALEKEITAKGSDEIAMLAGEMDRMRRSLIEQLGSEKRAWEANSELITAMSHDVRTPMTSLLGYLELLSGGGLSEEERSQFTASAYKKAKELKELTDELFRYFLAFGKAEQSMDMQRYDAAMLLEQLLGETVYDLTDQGFRVQQPELSCRGSLTVDPLYLKRVLDNLVSNLRKYADPAQPILFLTESGGGELKLCISNAIAPRGDRVESSKIGLRTCERLVKAMGGRFETRNDGKHFAAEITLPLEEAAP